MAHDVDTVPRDDSAVPERPEGLRQPSGPRPGKGRWLVVFGVLVALLAVGALKLPNWLPHLSNPFAEKTVDRSAPPLLKALEDLKEYHAASGHYEVIVDVEHDAKFLPSVIKGDRTLFVAVGSVDSLVDFSHVSDAGITVSPDRRTVALVLPRATLGEVNVDPNKSYVFSRERGVLDRIGGLFADSPTGEQEFYKLAQDKMLTAAGGDNSLTGRAEDNTRLMLVSMMHALGFTEVTVTFA